MPDPATLTALFVNYEQTLLVGVDIVHTENSQNLTPPNLTDSEGVEFQCFAEFEVDSGHWIVHFEANGPIWGTDHLTFDNGPDFPDTFARDMDAFNGRNGSTWISGTGNFIATFTPHECHCILNTLHCAGLTLAGLCGTDKHTAAIVLGTAGGIVTGGIKADAARINGLLGGWYSWH